MKKTNETQVVVSNLIIDGEVVNEIVIENLEEQAA